MEQFPQNICFKYPWRDYQKEVLKELQSHLSDDKLNVIAPPGSGKTVLGLEVTRRLNKPALILSPSITIRNQWLDRFTQLFMEKEATKTEWMTTDPETPRFLTSTTYQMIYSLQKRKGEQAKDWIKQFQVLGLGTVVLDEAHHLTSEWWKALNGFLENFPSITLVSLTATPPYDVSPSEWERYRQLCGPVDSEIAVPELVRVKNLCPHQDYIYLSLPEKKETFRINEYRQQVRDITDEILAHPALIPTLQNHRWLNQPFTYVYETLENAAFVSSMAIYLHYNGITIPKVFYELMGIKHKKVPAWNDEWLEILLTGIFYQDKKNFPAMKDQLKEWEKRLKKAGAIRSRQVSLGHCIIKCVQRKKDGKKGETPLE